MVDIPAKDWNPFLWAGGKLTKPKKKDEKDEEEQGLRTQQEQETADTAAKAGGIVNIHLESAMAPASHKGAGHKAWLGPIIPPKPKSLEGVPSVRINPETKKLEAYPEYQEIKSRLQHFAESMDAARGNPHRVEFSGGM